jgi:hypothetical protein
LFIVCEKKKEKAIDEEKGLFALGYAGGIQEFFPLHACVRLDTARKAGRIVGVLLA